MWSKSVMILLLLIIAHKTYSQCCSAGGSAGFSTNVGILAAKQIRIITSYRNSSATDFYKNNKPFSDTSKDGFAENNFSMINISYGITRKITLDFETGYFINKIQKDYIFGLDTTFLLKGTGFSNGIVGVKYSVYYNLFKGWEVTTGIGIKFPYSKKLKEIEGGDSPDLQPSTNASGGVFQLYITKFYNYLNLKFILMNRSEYNFENIADYQYGSSFTTSLFISKKLLQEYPLNAVLQIRNEMKNPDKISGIKFENSGARLVFIAPQINYSYKDFTFSGVFDFPLYRYYYGKQMANKFSVAAAISWNYSLKYVFNKE